MVFSSSGCYYGVLNVLDPTVRYDADGKIIAAVRQLPASDGNAYGESRDEVIVVETVESTILEEDQAFHPEVTYVSETDLEQRCLIEPIEENSVDEVNAPVHDSVSFQNTEEQRTDKPPQARSREATHKLNEPSAEISATGSDSQSQRTDTLSDNKDSPEDSEPVEGIVAVDTVSHTSSKPFPDTGANTVSDEPILNKESDSQKSDPQVSEPPAESASAVEQKTDPQEDHGKKEEDHEKKEEDEEEAKPDPIIESGDDGVLELTEVPAGESAPQLGQALSGGSETRLPPKPIFIEEQSMLHVVDYHMERTMLFKSIQEKNWQGVLYFLRTGSFSFSMIPSSNITAVKQQVQTWVSKKDESGKELWRQLPLHAAICFGAPPVVVEKLILAYEEALKSPDCHGNLPLHLAFIFDADDLVTSVLMKTFPAALHVMNFQGLQPIQCSSEISSETFQNNAELFGALSDYTRAVAENDPEKLIDQLQEVKLQLRAISDTLFASAPPRKPEAIKEYMSSAPASMDKNSRAVVEYGPSAFVREIAFGLCHGSVHDQVQQEMSAQKAPAELIVLDDYENGVETPAQAQPDAPARDPIDEPGNPAPQSCRVMEYCPKTKTWKEV